MRQLLPLLKDVLLPQLVNIAFVTACIRFVAKMFFPNFAQYWYHYTPTGHAAIPIIVSILYLNRFNISHFPITAYCIVVKTVLFYNMRFIAISHVHSLINNCVPTKKIPNLFVQ